MSETMTAEIDSAEADALQELGDEIATLAAHVHAATHRMLTMIVELVAQNLRHGIAPDFRTSRARYRREETFPGR